MTIASEVNILRTVVDNRFWCYRWRSGSIKSTLTFNFLIFSSNSSKSICGAYAVALVISSNQKSWRRGWRCRWQICVINSFTIKFWRSQATTQSPSVCWICGCRCRIRLSCGCATSLFGGYCFRGGCGNIVIETGLVGVSIYFSILKFASWSWWWWIDRFKRASVGYRLLGSLAKITCYLYLLSSVWVFMRKKLT